MENLNTLIYVCIMLYGYIRQDIKFIKTKSTKGIDIPAWFLFFIGVAFRVCSSLFIAKNTENAAADFLSRSEILVLLGFISMLCFAVYTRCFKENNGIIYIKNCIKKLLRI